MIYIFYGADTYSRSQELVNIKKLLGEVDMLAVNTSILDGSKILINDIRDACWASPFLNPYRLVIVEGYIGRFEADMRKRADKKPGNTDMNNYTDEWKTLAEYIKQVPRTNTLVFVDGALSSSNPVLRILSPLAQVKKFPLLNDANLMTWVVDRVHEADLNISTNAVKLLISLVGNDLWALQNEVNKLISYCQGRLITEDDVKQITSYSREINIFNLVDRIIAKEIAKAQLLAKRMIKEGATNTYILTMILRQLRLIILAKHLDKETSQVEALAKLGLHSEYALHKTMQQANNYTIEQLQCLYEKLLDLDVDIKTGKYTGEIELDLMIFELCQEGVN